MVTTQAELDDMTALALRLGEPEAWLAALERIARRAAASYEHDPELAKRWSKLRSAIEATIARLDLDLDPLSQPTKHDLPIKEHASQPASANDEAETDD